MQAALQPNSDFDPHRPSDPPRPRPQVLPRAQLERRVHAWRGAVELDEVASLPDPPAAGLRDHLDVAMLSGPGLMQRAWSRLGDARAAALGVALEDNAPATPPLAEGDGDGWGDDECKQLGCKTKMEFEERKESMKMGFDDVVEYYECLHMDFKSKATLRPFRPLPPFRTLHSPKHPQLPGS